MAFDISIVKGYGMVAWKWAAFIISGLLIAGVIYLIVYYFLRVKKYNYNVVIREIGYDGKPKIVGYDKGGIFLNRKTQFRLFLLKKNKVGLTPDNIPFEETLKNKKIVNVLRLGLKQYRYLSRPVLSENSPISMAYDVGDTDVGWAINTIELTKMYEKKNLLEKLLPFLGMAFVFLTVIVALYFIFVKAGFNADLLNNLASAAESIAKSLAAASSGTTVVPGGG